MLVRSQSSVSLLTMARGYLQGSNSWECKTQKPKVCPWHTQKKHFLYWEPSNFTNMAVISFKNRLNGRIMEESTHIFLKTYHWWYTCLVSHIPFNQAFPVSLISFSWIWWFFSLCILDQAAFMFWLSPFLYDMVSNSCCCVFQWFIPFKI